MTRFAFPDLTRAFRNGERFGNATIRVIEVDHLVLPTGRIVACDPGYLMSRPREQLAYARAVPAGRYPVLLSLLVKEGWPTENPNRESVACAAVQFQEARVERWEMALRPGWDLSTLKPGYHLGYGVDGGTGCFVDECAVAHLPDGQPAFYEVFEQAQAKMWAAYQEGQANPAEAMRRLAAEPGWRDVMYRPYQTIVPPGLGEVLGAIFDPNRVRRPAWSAVLHPETGANLVRFRSGDGDGCYASYFGLAADGSAACLVTDFGLLVRSIMATLEIPVPVRKHSELTHPRLADVGIESIQVDWKRKKGEVIIDLGDALYDPQVSFENRPSVKAQCTMVGGSAFYFHLDEPLQPMARVLIEYTHRTEAL